MNGDKPVFQRKMARQLGNKNGKYPSYAQGDVS
jgi:hypothetical protein